MSHIHREPAFWLGALLGLALCLIALSHLPPASHLIQTRAKRDIKTSPEPVPVPVGEDEKAEHRWTGPGWPEQTMDANTELSLDLSLAKKGSELAAVGSLLHVEVVSQRGKPDTVLQMTWASLPGLHYHVTAHSGFGSSSGSGFVEALQQLCRQQHLEREWYLIVRDDVYVNTERLTDILLQWGGHTHVVLGVPSSTSITQCSLDNAIIFSRQALHGTCTTLKSCDQSHDQSHGQSLGSNTEGGPEKCLRASDAFNCMDVLKVTGSLYTADATSVHSASPMLSHTLFVGPVVAVEDLYKLHLVYTEQRISRLQHHMAQLAATASTHSPAKPRAKRNSPRTDFEHTVLQSHAAILNSSGEPFYEYFDKTGLVYSDSCVVSKSNASQSKALRHSQSLVHRFLTSQIGTDSSKMDYFGLRTVKPLSGLEYQFYTVHQDQINKRGYYYDKLYQVIVKQDYEKLRVVKKRTLAAEDITIVTIADDLSLLPELLTTLVQNCDSMLRSNSKCGVLLLYDTSLFGWDYDVSHLTTVIDSIDNRGMEIRTLDIGVSSHIMNNFQRAVVSVHETLRKNSLIVFLHPKSHISPHFLHRCQANTVAGKAAYFPIPFQLSPTATQVQQPDAGFWKNTDYDTFCVHTTDLQTLSILPKSPQMLYQFLVSLRQLEVRRTADTGVWRVWDDGICPHHDETSQLKCQQDLMFRNL